MELGLMIDLRVAKLGIRIYCYICTCRRVWTLRPPPKTVACPCINTGGTADYKPITLIKQTHLFSQVSLPFCLSISSLPRSLTTERIAVVSSRFAYTLSGLLGFNYRSITVISSSLPTSYRFLSYLAKPHRLIG